MKERGKGGAIVNISSILSGKLNWNGQCIYSVTKAAVERLTTAAAHELGQYQVIVQISNQNMIYHIIDQLYL